MSIKDPIINTIQNSSCVAGEGYNLVVHKKTKEMMNGGCGIRCLYSGLSMDIFPRTTLTGGHPKTRIGPIEHNIIVGRNLSEEQDNYLKGIVNILNYKYKLVDFHYEISNAPDDEWERIDFNAYDVGTRYIHLEISPESGSITENNVMKELHRASKIFMDVTEDFFRLLYTSIQK